jgi:hypothetical protein
MRLFNCIWFAESNEAKDGIVDFCKINKASNIPNVSHFIKRTTKFHIRLKTV